MTNPQVPETGEPRAPELTDASIQHCVSAVACDGSTAGSGLVSNRPPHLRGQGGTRHA